MIKQTQLKTSELKSELLRIMFKKHDIIIATEANNLQELFEHEKIKHKNDQTDIT